MDEPQLELKVKALNINAGKNVEIAGKCKALKDYIEFMDRSRKALKGKKTQQEKQTAMLEVIAACKSENILLDFLTKNEEAVVLSEIWEYNEELERLAIEKERREAVEEGRAEGRAEGIAEGRAEGRAEGIAEGIAKSNADNLESIVRYLIKNNSGLTPEQALEEAKIMLSS